MNNCLYWGFTSIAWSVGDWTWAECELIQEICARWGSEGVWWKNEQTIWSHCSGSNLTDCMVWGTTNIWWKNADWWWSQCSSSIGPTPPIPIDSGSIRYDGLDATTLIQPWITEPWNPYRAGEAKDKRKRLIKLICKVKGQTYEEEKEVGTMDISVDDIKMVVKTMTNINLDVKLEE